MSGLSRVYEPLLIAAVLRTQPQRIGTPGVGMSCRLFGTFLFRCPTVEA